MAKRDQEPAGKPDGEKQRTMIMLDKDVHRRFKAFCVLNGGNIEDVGAQWIAERLQQEERKAR